ncbi:MAG: ferrous iron transporter B [Erysipelotrichaceae bacterium]|nr:ferrous iron transporter B [Erysipelotrichaceae bacterium]MDY5252380.1 ferrous iron transporter B [Erysipelotrichaceae bacterium]
MRIAFAGNPNSGKTTMFNALTGRNERVGNWAGVTVERKESKIKKSFYSLNEELIAVDLPGAYSMSPFTSEESITSAYVKNEKPDVIINIVDATNLSRSLFFTTQLLELGIPVVIALNKSDINHKKDTHINVEALSKALGCPVVETISTANEHNGLKQVIAEVIKVKGQKVNAPYHQKDIDLHDKDAVETADRNRFEFVNKLVEKVETRKIKTNEFNQQDKIDNIITNKWIGIPLFAIVMWLVFDISQARLGPWIADSLAVGIENFQEWMRLMTQGSSPFMQALLVDGIIGGVGAVVGFLPLVMVMYFLIALLEDCGYMARVSVIMDPIFKRVGLSGKSIIPMVIGTGCAIPGIMACRTIKNERERRTTAMLTPFMPCGAKLPVIALFAGVFFHNASWVGTLMYFVGIAFVFLGALLVLKITGQKYRKSFFIMELPEYKWPSIKRATISMLERAKAYIIKAGTIILVCNATVQIMQSFNWQLQLVEEGMEHTSILASIASPFAILLIPLGFGVWQLAAAAITGFIAKENVVGTLAVVYGLTNFINVDDFVLVSGANEVAATMGLTAVAALAYLMFNLFTPPCFAAIGAMNSEMQDKKWLLGGVALQLGTGYTVAFFVYQIGTLITTGSLGTGFVPGLIAVIVFALIIGYLIHRNNKNFAKQYAFR